MVEINIENIVVSTQIANALDLDGLSAVIVDSKFNPEDFPGLIIHFTEPQSVILLFSTGKVVCTGAKKIEDVNDIVHKICAKVKNAGFQVFKSPDLKVQTIVASIELGRQLNINAIAPTLGLENIEYKPDEFPGLIYKMDDPTTTNILFNSGKIVCTAESLKDVTSAAEKINEHLISYGY